MLNTVLMHGGSGGKNSQDQMELILLIQQLLEWKEQFGSISLINVYINTLADLFFSWDPQVSEIGCSDTDSGTEMTIKYGATGAVSYEFWASPAGQNNYVQVFSGLTAPDSEGYTFTVKQFADALGVNKKALIGSYDAYIKAINHIETKDSNIVRIEFRDSTPTSAPSLTCSISPSKNLS